MFNFDFLRTQVWILVISIAAAVSVAYKIGLGIQRIYFHPLSFFPGPKLAAASTIYRIYYCLARHGSMHAQIEHLHQIYSRPAGSYKPKRASLQQSGIIS